jgi:hypothetical protein
MQAAIGGREQRLAAVRRLHHCEPVHVSGDEALVLVLPGRAAVLAAIDAPDLDRCPHRAVVYGIEQDLGDPCRARIHIRGRDDAGCNQPRPVLACIRRAPEARRPRAGDHDIRIPGIDRDSPHVLHRRWKMGPPRGRLIPPENAHVAAREQPLGRRRVARDRPDASLQIHAGMAVRMHPRDAAVVAEPGGMPAGAGIDMHLARGGRCLCHGVLPGRRFSNRP